MAGSYISPLQSLQYNARFELRRGVTAPHTSHLIWGVSAVLYGTNGAYILCLDFLARRQGSQYRRLFSAIKYFLQSLHCRRDSLYIYITLPAVYHSTDGFQLQEVKNRQTPEI